MQEPDSYYIYQEMQADFYHWLTECGGLARKTCGDYVTRLKFLSRQYRLDDSLTEEGVKKILMQESEKIGLREKYNTAKSISDFSAGLKKFLAFVKSNYTRSVEKKTDNEVTAINADTAINITERQQLIMARVGQGVFRRELIDYWHCCALCGCRLPFMLVASHIKPWHVSDNRERLDVYNGLLLKTDYDRLFDQGYISFNQRGKIMISRLLDKEELMNLGLSPDLYLEKMETQHAHYLRYHNEHVFLQ